MPNELNKHCSDVEAARAASRSLRSGSPVAPTHRGYIRFDASRLSAASTTASGAAIPSRSARYGPASWDRLLEEAITAVAGESAFLMNEQGLVIANQGTLDADTAEAFGARTQLALEQIDAIAEPSARRRVLACDLGTRWLFGVRFKLADDTSVTLGLFTEDPPEGDRRETLLSLVDAVAAQEREPTSLGGAPPSSTEVSR